MIESKVIAATAGGATGGVVGSFVLWLLGVLVWGTPSDAAHAVQAVGAVPEPVGGFALFLLAGGAAFIGGYLAPHTPRPDLNPPPAEAPVPAVVPLPVTEATPPTDTVTVRLAPDTPAPTP